MKKEKEKIVSVTLTKNTKEKLKSISEKYGMKFKK